MGITSGKCLYVLQITFSFCGLEEDRVEEALRLAIWNLTYCVVENFVRKVDIFPHKKIDKKIIRIIHFIKC